MADSTVTPSSTRQQRGRGATMCRKLDKVRHTGIKLKIRFNQITWNCFGPDSKLFKTYLAFLARSNCSILKDECKEIGKDVKDKIWEDLESYFVIPVIDPDPDKDPLRKVWFQFAGDRWRGFKAQLTREYVTKPDKAREPPYVRYTYISKDVWEKFLASRATPEFKARSQIGREKAAKNIHPHRLSRGGYELLTEKMMAEKRSLQDSTLSDERSPSPPPREEKWKRARQGKDGEYKSAATKVVADKIDSLVEETAKGTFVPNGHNDILTNAIGTAEHGGRVRGAERGANISNYFGRSLRSTQNINVTEQLSQLETTLRAEFETTLENKLVAERQAMMETLKSMGFSQVASPTKQVVEECSPKHIGNGSVKASCSVAPANIKEVSDHDIDSVEKLLCMILKRKKYLPVHLEHDACVSNFKMSPSYMKDLLVGDKWVDLSVLQLWCTYMHRLSIATNNSDLYAFLDPCQLNFAAKPNSIQKAGKQYIQNKLRDVKKECYLAPYLMPKHWKLIIMCPKDNIIVCLCSLHQKVDEATKKYFTDAFMVHQFACGNRKKPTWIFPKTRVQPNGNDCGYYVMKNMIDIVSASVTKKWDEVFNDPTALSEDDLYELRNRWATCFLDLYNPEKDYDDGDDDGAKGR
ncbi:hypothetical protein QL285_076664 [Trifolium repens]|nr:hypothetical protein QL285_076664 [Trifolium repens]